MGWTGCVSPNVAGWLAVIGAFRSSLLLVAAVSSRDIVSVQQVWSKIVLFAAYPSAPELCQICPLSILCITECDTKGFP